MIPPEEGEDPVGYPRPDPPKRRMTPGGILALYGSIALLGLTVPVWTRPLVSAMDFLMSILPAREETMVGILLLATGLWLGRRAYSDLGRPGPSLFRVGGLYLLVCALVPLGTVLLVDGVGGL